MFKGRSTGEILVIMVGATVCGYVVVFGTILIGAVFFTDRDVSEQFRNVADVINTLIGLLAGYLAGRTDTATIKRAIQEGQKETSKEPE